MNKILDDRIPWNPGLTRSEIMRGFQELMVSGVYEREFFGDMMMAGIACGVRKLILIFNTHEMTLHDPIAVIDPAHYGGTRDCDIPVVLAYDLVHYESLHPVDQYDIEETIKLAKCYIAKPSTYRQEYGFTRQDMRYLVSPSKEEIDRSKQCDTAKNDFSILGAKKNKVYEEYESFKFEGICFKELRNGNVICGICQVECIRLVVHMNESSLCSGIFSMDEFRSEYSKYRDRRSRRKRITSETKDNFKAPR